MSLQKDYSKWFLKAVAGQSNIRRNAPIEFKQAISEDDVANLARIKVSNIEKTLKDFDGDFISHGGKIMARIKDIRMDFRGKKHILKTAIFPIVSPFTILSDEKVSVPGFGSLWTPFSPFGLGSITDEIARSLCSFDIGNAYSLIRGTIESGKIDGQWNPLVTFWPKEK